MSYDLFLYEREGASALSLPAFLDYFKGDRYEKGEREVHYSNPDTGVYFNFSWSEGGEGDSKTGRQPRPGVAFNMNYFRPHTFGLEAEPIVTRFVRHFDLVVDDPQSEGMGKGKYTPEGFLRGWNAGNRFAADAFRSMGAGQDTLSLPAETNRRLWDWNAHREDMVEELIDEEIGVYVPPIWFCREDGQVRTFCLYPNLVPTAVPRTDYVLVLRTELSSPYKKKSKKTPGWVRWDELRAVTGDFEVRNEKDSEELTCLVLFSEDYADKDTAPKALAEWVIGLPDWPGKPDQVTPDQVLDAELLAGGDE